MIIDCLKTNRINAPDGDYFILTPMMDYKLKTDKPIWKTYKSKTKVEVRGGLLETGTLIKASSEIIDDCGYWGKYLEQVNYNSKDKTLNIGIGS
tara:strand:+ start:1217 stop:1498 length:282 start_codon:yes stop_codon:yes gene_type:complete